MGLRRRVIKRSAWVCVLRRLLASKRVCKPFWSTCTFGACSAFAAPLAKAIKTACLSMVWLNLILLLAAEASLDWQKLEL